MKHNYYIFFALLFLTTNVFSQDWGADSILNPSFANDNRFNQYIDLSGNQNTTPELPDWTQDLILYQMRIDNFGELPTINSAKEKLWVLKKLGITGVVLNPMSKCFKGFSWDGQKYWNFYTHTEPQELDPALGTEQDFIDFVNELHSMGIKVFLDFEVHGVFNRDIFRTKMDWLDAYNDAGPEQRSSLLTTHPDFFNWETDTFVVADDTTYKRPVYTGWNSAELIWSRNGVPNTELMDWYKNMLIYDWLIKYDLDGFRLDLEPFEVANEVGYSYWESVKALAKAETGKDIVLIPEDGDAERNNAFAFAQEDFGVSNPRFGWSNKVKDFMVTEHLTNYPENNPEFNLTVDPVNIVDVVKSVYPYVSRDETFYSSAISSHDNRAYTSDGHLVYFGYGTLFQPFIPFWFMGNEFNTRNLAEELNYDEWHNRIYFSRLTWDDFYANQEHFNEVRKMIKIRKQYKNLIGPSTHRLKDKNMVKIEVIGTQPDLPAYGYFNAAGDSVGIIVLGTKQTQVPNIRVKLPLTQMRLNNVVQYEFHNLLDDTKQILTAQNGDEFILEDLPAWSNLIYKIEPYHNLTPVCHITTPSDLQEFHQGESFLLNVNAHDDDGSIQRVDFYVNGAFFYSDNAAPYEYNINTDNTIPPGDYTFSAIAYDNTGDSTQSNFVIVKLLENQAPTCSIISPTNGQVFTQNDNILFSAEANDIDGSLDSVVFVLDSTPFVNFATPPYVYNFQSDINTPAGTYMFYVIAYDNFGLATYSDTNTVILNELNTEILNNNEDSDYSLYPNPVTKGRLTIKTKKKTIKKLTVFDITGKEMPFKIISFGKKIVIDVSKLKNGIYFIKTDTFIQKFVINI